MFTGLVEAVGHVLNLKYCGEQAELTLALPFADELALGDSVAVNGCCLTVARQTDGKTSFDLLGQTLKLTSLGSLVPGSVVNLERAMMAGARFGGHFVQGHVDAVGVISKLDIRGQDHILEVSLPSEVSSLCINQGSLTIDGISLTIAELDPPQATFWITPHTWIHTHLHTAAVGQSVNLEIDLLAKYVEKIILNRSLKTH